MGRLFLHYLTPAGLESWRWSRSRMQCMDRHPESDAGRQAFGAWLDLHAKDEHRLLVGLREEELRLIPCPKLTRGETRELLRRRLQQHYPDTPFVTGFAVRALKPSPGAGLILAAIPPPSSLQFWADVLLKHEAMLTSIRSPALLLPRILSTLNIKIDAGLLVFTSSAGLHHVQFENGLPHFTRLVADPATDQQLAHTEIERTLQHISTRKTAAQRTPLDIIWLTSETGHVAASSTAHVAGLQIRNVRIPPTTGLAPRTGHRDDGTGFLLELTAGNDRGPQFAPASHLKRRHTRLARTRVLALGAAGCAGLGLLAAANVEQASTLRPRIEEARQALDTKRAEHARLAREMASLPMDVTSLMTLHRSAESAAALASTRNALLRKLSTALDQHPGIDLDSLSWVVAPNDAAGPKRMRLNIDGSPNGAAPIASDPLGAFRQTLTTLEFEIEEHAGPGQASSPRPGEVAPRPSGHFSWQLSLPEEGAP